VAAIHGCFGHDVLAFIYLTNPELFTLETGRIRVATEGLAQGQTIMKRAPFEEHPQAGWGPDTPITHVCLQVQADACKTIFERTLLAPWL
jgi:inosine-uridine nucleoside N-ribohydrolase